MEFEVRPPAKDGDILEGSDVELESPGIADSLGDGRFFLEIDELKDKENSFTVDMPGVIPGVVIDTKDGTRKKYLKLAKSLALSLFVNSGIGVSMNESLKVEPIKDTSVEGVLKQVEELEQDKREVLDRYSKEMSDKIRPIVEKYFEKSGEELFNQGIGIEVFASLSSYERTYEKIRSGIIIDAEKARNDAENGKKYLIRVYQKRLGELLERTSGNWTGDIKEDTLTLLREGYWSEEDINLFRSKLKYQEDAHSLEDNLLSGEANCTLSKLTPILLKDIYEHQGIIFHPAEIGSVIWQGHVETGLRVLENGEIVEYLVQESDIKNPIKNGLTPPGSEEGTFAPSVFHVFNEMASVDFISEDLIHLAEASLETALETQISQGESIDQGKKSRAEKNFAKNSFQGGTDSVSFFEEDKPANELRKDSQREASKLNASGIFIGGALGSIADRLSLSSSTGPSEGVYFLELPEIERNDDLKKIIDFLDINNRYFQHLIEIDSSKQVPLVEILNSINFTARISNNYQELLPYIRTLEETLIRRVIIEEEIPSILYRAGMADTIERNAKFFAEYLSKPENIEKIKNQSRSMKKDDFVRVDFAGWEKALEILEGALSPEEFAPLIKYREIINNYRGDSNTDLLTNKALEYKFEKLPDISSYTDEELLDLFGRLNYRALEMTIREIIYKRPHLIEHVLKNSGDIMFMIFQIELGVGETLIALREVSKLIQSGDISEYNFNASDFETNAIVSNLGLIIRNRGTLDDFKEVIVGDEGMAYLEKLEKIADSGMIDLETIDIFKERRLLIYLRDGKSPALKEIIKRSYFNSRNRELKKQIISYAHFIFSEHEVEIRDIELYKRATKFFEEYQQRGIKAVENAINTYSK